MKRHLFLRCLTLLTALAVSSTAAIGQDKIERKDRKSEKTAIVSCKILEESMAGVKVKIGTKEELIPGSEIVRISYEDVPGSLKLAYSNLFINEEKEKDPAKILKEYNDLKIKAGNATDLKPAVKRYIEYRIAMLQAQIADNDVAKNEAQAVLAAFVGSHGSSWEYPFVAMKLVRMQSDKGDYEGATKILDALARTPTVPPDIKQDAATMLIDVMFQAGKGEEAKPKINAALADPNLSEDQKARYRVYLTGIEAQAPNANLDEEVKKLDAIIAKSSDNTLKAVAYNLMGDCYLQKGRKRDAMWSYLWVDVVFSQDKNEHIKAMTKLSKIFQDDNDELKVQFYKDKLNRLK